MKKKKNFDGFSSLWLWNFDFHPHCAPWGSVGQANKTSPRFYPGQASAVLPRYLNSSRYPHCSVQMILIMSSSTSSYGSEHSSISFFCISLQKLKKWHMCKKIIRRGHVMPVPLTSWSICCSYHEIKGESWHHFFVIARNLMMGTPEQVIKVPFKTNNSSNSLMMA